MSRTIPQQVNLKLRKNQKWVYYALAVVLLLAPLFRGLYFSGDMLTAAVLIAVLFSFFNISRAKQPGKINLQVIDIGAGGLFAAYLLSTFSAVKLVTAVEADIRLAIYLMVYIMAAGIMGNARLIRSLLTVVYTSGMVTALIGLAAFGGAQISGAITGGRMSSVFQYPNTFGAFLAAAGLIGLYLILTSTERNTKLIIGAGNLFIFTALFGTGSRGTFLVFPVVYLAYLMLQPGIKKVEVILYTLANLVMGSIASFLITNKQGSQSIWMVLLVCAVINVVLYYGINMLLSKRDSRFGNKNIIRFATAFGVLALAAAVYLGEGGALKRITEIDFRHRSVIERGYFYLDGLKIIQDNPLLGIGGGGWSAIYKAYQSYGYISSQIHSYYLQIWVETGILGIVSILAVLIGTVMLFLRIRRREDAEEKELAAVILGAAFMLALHSAIDFNMAYGMIGILFWMLLGLLRSLSIESVAADKDRSGNVIRVAGIILPLFIAGASFSLIMANDFEEQAKVFSKQRNTEQRLKYIERASIFNPFDGDNFANLALLERAAYKKDEKKEHLESALVYAQKAIDRDKGSQAFRVQKINILFRLERFEEAAREAEKTMTLAPLDQESYHLLAHSYLSAGEYYLKAGDQEKAKMYLDKTVRVPVLMKKKMEGLNENQRKFWTATPQLKLTEKLQNYISKAVFLRNDL